MRNILIVDDEFGLAEALSAGFEQLGYATATAINGRLGLAACAQARPDVILLDLMMPVLSGLEMLEALKADAELRSVPVVLMSAAGRDAIPERLAPQVCGFLQKPFTMDEVMAVIAPILGPDLRD